SGERIAVRSAVDAARGGQFWILDFRFWIGFVTRCLQSKIQNPKSKICGAIIVVCLCASSPLRAAVEIPVGYPTQSITLRAGAAEHWEQGGYEGWVLRGSVQIKEGKAVARSNEGLLWINRAQAYSDQPSKVIAYLEGNVIVEYAHDPMAAALGGKEKPRLED